MEKLIVLSEDGVSQEFPLTEQMTSIGRDEHNRICLSDKSVSRHHATVKRVFKGFTIQDEESTNGTRVNGRVITKQFLKHRDLIEIGKYHLRFIESSPEQLIDDDKTTIIRRPTHQSELIPPSEKRGSIVSSKPVSVVQPQTAAPEPEQIPAVEKIAPKAPPRPSAPIQPQVAPASANGAETELAGEGRGDVAKIIYLAGDQKGQELMLDRAFFSVGEPGGDLVLINKRHTGYFLLKVGGDVPPTINGTPIKAGGVELHDGDRIDLGKLSLEFRV
jgi:pSer/pThr/pTyr-binding forkhead associated (FHA) protein